MIFANHQVLMCSDDLVYWQAEATRTRTSWDLPSYQYIIRVDSSSLIDRKRRQGQVFNPEAGVNGRARLGLDFS